MTKKDGMGLRMEDPNGGSLKNKIFRGGGVMKTQYIADCLKGGLGQFTDSREGLAKMMRWSF